MKRLPSPRLITDAMISTGPSASERYSMPGRGTAPIADGGPPAAPLADLGTSDTLGINFPPGRVTRQPDKNPAQTGPWTGAGGSGTRWEEC